MLNIIYDNELNTTYENGFMDNNSLPYDLAMKNLRDIINQELANRGWNVTRLAKESGVPQPTLHRFLSGMHGEPRSSTIKKIANGFGLTEIQLRSGHFDVDNMDDIREQIPVFMSADDFMTLPVKVRAFIEELLTRYTHGLLTDDHVKLLHSLIDELAIKKGEKERVKDAGKEVIRKADPLSKQNRINQATETMNTRNRLKKVAEKLKKHH
ncbi:MAG: helix-turn-helix domain-containing protein [Methylobacter sp.]